jgi:VWFA-related protein
MPFRNLALLLFLCFSWNSLLAQSDAPASATTPQQPASDTLTFHSTVRRVVVDVVVRDSDHRAVHGLTAKDFVVTEDGHPQNILSFDVHDFDTPSIAMPANAPKLPVNHFVNIPATPERGPLYVILYDLVNTEIADQPDARRQVMNFIKKIPSGARFAFFVHSDTLALVQGFTDDKNLLYAALDPQHPKPHVPMVFMMGKNLGYGDPVSTMNILTQITQYLEGIPGHKNLIWLAGTFPLALFPRKEDPVEYQDDIRAEINVLTRAEVAVYPINVSGVPVNPPGQLTGARVHGGAANQNVLSGGQINGASPQGGGGGGNTVGGINSLEPGAGQSLDPTGLAASMGAQGSGDSAITDYMVQKGISEATGGQAFWSTNDVTGALDEVTEVDGNYYTLTYSPTNKNDDGKRRSIRVNLDKKELKLAYRRFYYTGAYGQEKLSKAQPGSASQPSAAAEADALQPNMKHGAPMMHDLLFSAHIRPDGSTVKATRDEMAQLAAQPAYAAQKKDKLAPVDLQKYWVDYRVTDNALKAPGAKSPEFEFAAAAYDSESRMLNSSLSNAGGDSNPDAGKTGVFRARLEFSVPDTASSIRIGVRDKLTNRIGTLEVQLPLAPEAPSPSVTSAR